MKANLMSQLQTHIFNSYSLRILGTNASEFFFFQNTVNAKTLHGRIDSSKNMSINSIADIATFFYIYH